MHKPSERLFEVIWKGRKFFLLRPEGDSQADLLTRAQLDDATLPPTARIIAGAIWLGLLRLGVESEIQVVKEILN